MYIYMYAYIIQTYEGHNDMLDEVKVGRVEIAVCLRGQELSETVFFPRERLVDAHCVRPF